MDTQDGTQKCHSLVTEEAVKTALRNDKGSGAQLTSFRIEDFTKKGDNYMAMVTSVKVDFTLDGKEDKVSYVVKINPCRGFKEFEDVTTAAFNKEAEFYTELLPKLNSVLKEAGFNPFSVPQGYHCVLDEGKQLIFLEDLRPRGFKMFDRRKGLDIPHATLVLKELAALHAASMLLQKKEPEYHKETLLHTSWHNLTPQEDVLLPMLAQHLDSGVLMLKKIGGYESSIQFLESTKTKLSEMFKKSMEPTKYTVICHGDVHNNNILFRYDDNGVPQEVMFVDLQLCRRETLAVDLNYLLYTSFTGEGRKPNLDSFLDTYRRQFNAISEAGGSDLLLEQEELKTEFRNNNVFGVIYGTMASCAMLVEPEDVPDMENTGGEDSMQKVMDDFRSTMLDLLDTNPLVKPRFLAVFDEAIETGLIPS